MSVDDYLVLLLTCTLTAAIICLDTVLMCCCLLNTIIVIIIWFWDFSWSFLCYTKVSVLVLGIGIARGQYYWVLDIGCLSWYRSNPTSDLWEVTCHMGSHPTQVNSPCLNPSQTGWYSIVYFENCLLLLHCFLQQPEVYRCMETTTSGINIPLELISSDIEPVVVLETLNLTR